MSRNARKTHSSDLLRKALQALWLSKVATNPTQNLWRFWQSATDTMWLKTEKIAFPRDKRHIMLNMCVQDIEAEHQEKKTKQESEETKAQAF